MATWTTIPDADLTTGKPGKQYIFRALRDNIDAALSGDPSAPKIQSGAFDDAVITVAKIAATSAGNYVVADSNTSTSTTSTSYVKVKEIRAYRIGSIRTTFLLSEAGGGTAFGRIYKNGVAIGTERTTTSSTPVSFTEDFSGILVGDLIQLYIHDSGIGTTYSIGLQYKVSNPMMEIVTL